MGRDDSRQKGAILEAATRVFGADGFHAATIRAVGRAAGVNSALIYYYFADKETLFGESVRRVIEEFLQYLENRQAPCRGAEARIRFLVDGIFGYFTEHPERLRLVGLALAQHPEVLSEAVRGSFHRGIPLPMRILLDGIEKGELAPLHPVQTWWGMLGMCLYSVYMYRAFTERTQDALPIPLPTAEQRHEQIVQTLLHGLSRRPAGRRPGRKEKPS